MLHGNIGLGNSVISTASGHRVELITSQDMTIDPYLLVGLNTNAQWYLYEIYRAGKLIKSLTAIISAQFLTKVIKRGTNYSKNYTRFLAKKRHAYS